MSVGVGIVGCGNISEVYLVNAKLFRDIRVVACADIDVEAAKRQADRHGVVAASVADLLKRDDVDVVLNLTIPEAHAEVSLSALECGKHVYSEKPLATTVLDGERILAAADRCRLRVGAAPDTILGAGTRQRVGRSTRAKLAGPCPPSPRSCPMAWNIGIRTLAFSSGRAPVRCSTWGPTTSPRL